MNRWRKFWRLSAAQRSLVVQALALLPLLELALRVVGFRRAWSALSQLVPDGTGSNSTFEQAAREQAGVAARIVAAASREGLCRGNCLSQSLTLWWLLHRQKIPGQLRIGVRKRVNELEAHAWVEFDGLVLNDRGDVHRHFLPFARDLTAVGVKEQ